MFAKAEVCVKSGSLSGSFSDQRCAAGAVASQQLVVQLSGVLSALLMVIACLKW